jgi:hypothetical protein
MVLGALMEREKLHELILLLKQQFEAGKISIRSAETIEELSRVRFAEDGKIDAESVGSSVRALALAVAAAETHRAMKQIPLLEVNREYFGILDPIFGKPFAEMKRHGLNPQILAEDMASRDNLVNAFTSDLESLAGGLKEFWDYYGPVVQAHLRDLRSLKVVFGGDIFPSYTANIACSVGLYADTVVLPDPLHKLITFAGIMAPKELFRLAAKHALNALCYKDLALAETDVPIVVITPDYLADADYRSALQIAAEEDTLEHYSLMFGTKFSSRDQFVEFLRPLSDYELLVSKIVDPSRMLFDTEWSGTLLEQFKRYAEEFPGQFGAVADARMVLEQMLLGRMMQTNDAVFRGFRYGGTPLIDAPTSWRYLQWKYEYQGSLVEACESQRDVLIAKVMSLEGVQHNMLSGIPSDALIELRKNGASADLREIIRKGINEIDTASDGALLNVGKQVIGNIDDALAKHARELNELSASRRKFYGVDVARWVVPGALSIAATAVHSVPLAFLAVASAMSGSLRPEELRNRYQVLKAESARLRRSPAGIMFRHIKSNFGFP